MSQIIAAYYHHDAIPVECFVIFMRPVRVEQTQQYIEEVAIGVRRCREVQRHKTVQDLGVLAFAEPFIAR